MFKLLRLAIYALVGYAAYQFVMDVINSAGEREEAPAPSRGGGARSGRGGGRTSAARMTGARRGGGAGRTEATQDADGGSTPHRVGRGVV